MKKLLTYITVFAAAASSLFAVPQKVVFDTDMGNDIDDALALLMLLNYHKKSDIDLIGIAVNKDNKFSAPYINIVDDFYGCPDIPMGMVEKGIMPQDNKYIRSIFEAKNPDGTYRFSRRLDDGKSLPTAVKFLRRLLSQQGDGEVVYISVGFFTNLADLLKSGADEISPLTGKELVAKKVKYVSAMAGDFSEQALKNPSKKFAEYNVRCDALSSKYVFENCPSPILFSGFEIGKSVCYPHKSIKEDFKFSPTNPVSEAYELYTAGISKDGIHNRPSWDLTSVLIVAEPEYFKLSPFGTVTCDADGVTYFKPDAHGLHRYILPLSKDGEEKVTDRLVELCTSLHP